VAFFVKINFYQQDINMNKNGPQKLDVRSTCQLTLCTGTCVSICIDLGASARNVLLFQPVLSPFFSQCGKMFMQTHRAFIPTHNYLQNIVSLEVSDIIVLLHIDL
jgi:hypothetical protein